MVFLQDADSGIPSNATAVESNATATATTQRRCEPFRKKSHKDDTCAIASSYQRARLMRHKRRRRAAFFRRRTCGIETLTRTLSCTLVWEGALGLNRPPEHHLLRRGDDARDDDQQHARNQHEIDFEEGNESAALSSSRKAFGEEGDTATKHTHKAGSQRTNNHDRDGVAHEYRVPKATSSDTRTQHKLARAAFHVSPQAVLERNPIEVQAVADLIEDARNPDYTYLRRDTRHASPGRDVRRSGHHRKTRKTHRNRHHDAEAASSDEEQGEDSARTQHDRKVGVDIDQSHDTADRSSLEQLEAGEAYDDEQENDDEKIHDNDLHDDDDEPRHALDFQDGHRYDKGVAVNSWSNRDAIEEVAALVNDLRYPFEASSSGLEEREGRNYDESNSLVAHRRAARRRHRQKRRALRQEEQFLHDTDRKRRHGHSSLGHLHHQHYMPKNDDDDDSGPKYQHHSTSKHHKKHDDDGKDSGTHKKKSDDDDANHDENTDGKNDDEDKSNDDDDQHQEQQDVEEADNSPKAAGGFFSTIVKGVQRSLYYIVVVLGTLLTFFITWICGGRLATALYTRWRRMNAVRSSATGGGSRPTSASPRRQKRPDSGSRDADRSGAARRLTFAGLDGDSDAEVSDAGLHSGAEAPDIGDEDRSKSESREGSPSSGVSRSIGAAASTAVASNKNKLDVNRYYGRNGEDRAAERAQDPSSSEEPSSSAVPSSSEDGCPTDYAALRHETAMQARRASRQERRSPARGGAALSPPTGVLKNPPTAAKMSPPPPHPKTQKGPPELHQLEDSPFDASSREDDNDDQRSEDAEADLGIGSSAQGSASASASASEVYEASDVYETSDAG
ncbi:unnamed protein product [Amoebophrya sp. A25]|nr:unnamed protein product [Amoebophrya sp. A25]|eukprot:GSA25T00016633001.1